MEHNQQSEQIKLCPACGAKNKSAYVYCNECGAQLSATAPQQQPVGGGYTASGQSTYFTPAAPVPTGQTFSAASATPTAPVGAVSFDGVSAEDMFTYTGRKPKLYEKLQRQQMAPTNKIFCLPLFLLGFFFGFFGMACWYLYHKLYKQATIFLVLTAVLFGVSMISAVDLMGAVTEWYSGFLDQITSNSNLEYMAPEQIYQWVYGSLFEALGNHSGALTVIGTVLSYVGSLAQFALAIIMPFYAYESYRKTAIRRIQTAYAKQPMPNIAAVGGTNVGLLAVAIVVYVILNIVASVVLVAPFMQAVMEQLAQITPEYDPYYYEY